MQQVSEETFIKIGAQGIFSGKSFEGAVWFSVSIDLCATWKPIKLSSVQQLLATLVVLSKGAIHNFVAFPLTRCMYHSDILRSGSAV